MSSDRPGSVDHPETLGILDQPVLTHPLVTLEPLAASHTGDLVAAAAGGELWQRAWYTSVPEPDEAVMLAEIERRIGLRDVGAMVPWAIVVDGRAVGMTTYMHIDAATPRLEIGSTWLAVAAQGTGVNAAMKLLLLERAFDRLGCVAVEFRTHFHNRQSRDAIERLGAKQDGVLRSHVLHRGQLRDTVVYSIVASEWPAVRLGLEARLAVRG
ncbi:Protein N-acetyltransferase, RimJ/RimL family [Agrococcus baldri]|uniref:Protein N-acetyltransferase, RimJ/RimL family n=1 Tax=Agrococcus baldri TaxID=153730 RepID=A0AA94HLP1_9MICO|nr:GNAT family protein [Agrococcus baldri]SFS08228.1 Protein N-acetyltransferase, RimJ/RimL family [Agrococcus baldri]